MIDNSDIKEERLGVGDGRGKQGEVVKPEVEEESRKSVGRVSLEEVICGDERKVRAGGLRSCVSLIISKHFLVGDEIEL